MSSESRSAQRDEFSIEFDLDEIKQRLTLRLEGKVVSQSYFDWCVAYYSNLEEPSRFDRLVDCTRSQGYVSFDHLNALSDLWRNWLSGAPRVVNVAVVTNDPLTHARMGLVDHLSDKQRHHAFFTIAEAEAWLKERRHG
jgi:hypothetical protein